jgi:beta-glucosidase-like glycosyl hydrolase
VDAATANLPFCDASLSIEQRLDDLLGRLNLTDMVGLLGPSPATSDCAFLDYGVTRLGIPPYLHLVETNTAVASACLGDKCATTFSGPTGLAASFNRTMWATKGEVRSSAMLEDGVNFVLSASCHF